MQSFNQLPFLTPAINLDFSKGIITPEIKFSGSAGYVQNSNGKLVATPQNQPRPIYRKGRDRSGLYMGRASTNLLANSSNASILAPTGWYHNNTAIAAENTQSPFEGGSSVKLSAAISTTHAQFNAILPAFTLNNEVVASCFVKAGNIDWIGMQIDSNYGGAIDYAYSAFKINKNDYYGTSADVGACIEPYGDDWFRIWVTRRFTPQSAPTTAPFLRLYPGMTSTQKAGDYVYICNPQIEYGSVPGMPIVTSGSQASVTEPTATIGFSSSKITALFRFREAPAVIPKTQQVLACFGDATNGIIICRGADETNQDKTKTEQMYYHYIVGGTLRYSAKVFLKRSLSKSSVFGFSIDPATNKVSIVGDTVLSFTEVWPAMSFGDLTLGKAFSFSYGAPFHGWCGDIERVLVYKDALSLEALKALQSALLDE